MILEIYIYITVIFIYVYIYMYIYISYTCTYRQSHIYHYIHDYDMHGFICYSKARGLKRRGVTSAVLSSNAFLLRACHCQSVFFVHCVYIIYVRVYVHAQYSLTCVCVCVYILNLRERLEVPRKFIGLILRNTCQSSRKHPRELVPGFRGLLLY